MHILEFGSILALVVTKYKPYMHNNCISVDKIMQLRKRLPHGSLRKIHEKTGFSYTKVSRVLSGKQFDQNIIEAAIEIVESEKEKANKLEVRLIAIQNQPWKSQS